MAQAKIISVEEARGRGCEFEEWSREKHMLAKCGCVPIASVSGHYICVDHIAIVLSNSKALALTGLKSALHKNGEKIDYKENFLKSCIDEAEKRAGKK